MGWDQLDTSDPAIQTIVSDRSRRGAWQERHVRRLRAPDQFSYADLADTWEWDGFRWRMFTSTNSPPARHEHAMAFDEQRQRVVLFGGNSARGLVNNDTWEWDGTNWTRALPAVAPPRPVSQCAMTYDRARQRILLVMASPQTETWEWDGVNWSRLAPATTPTGRSFSMAYDAQRRRAVLLTTSWNFGEPAKTWEWDGSNWTLAPVPAPEPAGFRWAMTYDPSRQRVLASGADLWQWDGLRWSLLAAGFGVDAMVVDEPRGRLLTMAWRGTAVTGSPATSARFGLGCSSSNRIPVLGQYQPFVGNESFAIDVVNSPASSLCVLGLSASSTVISMPGGCTLYLQQALFVSLLSSSSGVARARVPIPEVVALRGAQLYGQGFVADAGSALGLALTAPRVMTIGD